jgi:hypothetical protein
MPQGDKSVYQEIDASKQSDSGRDQPENHKQQPQGGRKGWRYQSHEERSIAAKKGWETRRRTGNR